MAMIYGPGFFAPGSEGADGIIGAALVAEDNAQRIVCFRRWPHGQSQVCPGRAGTEVHGRG